MIDENLLILGNLLESILWCAFALACAQRARRCEALLKARLQSLSVAFAAFGISDIVESSTGAWWDPWWLLVWKTACVIIIILNAAKLKSLSNSARRQQPQIQ